MTGARHAEVLGESSALSPFRHRLFLSIWLATLVSNLGGMIQAVGASWMMTTIAPSADMVALVQASTTLPVLLFALVSGALADALDRRLIMLTAQTLMLFASTALAIMALLHAVTPWSLLAMTFLVGCGAALHGPSWHASVGEQVPREDLAPAVALNSMGFNLARTAGPAIGGAIVAAAGPTATFLINAASYVALIVVLALWRAPAAPRTLPPEPLGQAISAGLRYALRARPVQTVLARALVFGAAGSAIWSLMPLVAKDVLVAGPATYGLLLGALGIGAVTGAFWSTALRRRMTIETLVRTAMAAYGSAIVLVSFSHNLLITIAALLCAGMAWVLTVSSCNVSVQMAAPRWVVGRAMSLFQMSLFGGMAAGSWAWGRIAELWSISGTLAASGVLVAITAVLMGRRWPLVQLGDLDLKQPHDLAAPQIVADVEHGRGPVVIMIEYRIPQERAAAFVRAITEQRRVREQNGARQWSIVQDILDPTLWVERYQAATWVDHLRQRQRVTAGDQAVKERVRQLHDDAAPPRVRRFFLWQAAAQPSPSGLERMK